jgi:hypothetical protein
MEGSNQARRRDANSMSIWGVWKRSYVPAKHELHGLGL